MTINEFLSEELKTLAVREMKHVLNVEEKNLLMEVFNSLLPEAEEKRLLEELSNNTSSLKLKNLQILLQELNTNDHDLKKIETKMKEKPLNRIYPLTWVYCMVELFRNDEFLDSEYAGFIRTVIDKYSYLVNLDDFLYNTGFLLIKPQNEQ